MINLAPKSVFEGSVISEAEILTTNNVKYIHIPVNFNKPKKEDFLKFVKSVEENKDKKFGFIVLPICVFQHLYINIEEIFSSSKMMKL